MPVEVTLREYEERWKAHYERHDLEDRALHLQAEEYERRLDLLNHEHTRTREVQLTYVARDVYDAEKREWDNRVRNLEKFQNNLIGRMVVIAFALATLAAIISAALVKRL